MTTVSHFLNLRSLQAVAIPLNAEVNFMTDRVLRRPEVTSMVGLGTTKLYELISEGSFPKPIKLSVRSVGWLESEVQAWIEEQANKRETAAS